MISMTGYGFCEKNYDNAVISVEIKSVNSRFLDLSINIPPFLNSLESYFRNLIASGISRGKVDVYIRVKELESDAKIIADTKIAQSYCDAIKQVTKALCLAEENIPVSVIINQPGVLNSIKDYDVDSYKKMIEPVFNEALKQFLDDAKREGENLKSDLIKKLAKLEECADFFEQWQPKMEEIFKNQIITRFKELLGEQIDENRIMTEVAAMLVKYTINEEIVRLKSHISAMKKEMEQPFPGKKLDFICQEMNREINTIGSKNQFAEVGEKVIEAKDSLENIREQSKNVA